MTAAMGSGVSEPVAASHAKERMPLGVSLPTSIRLDAGFGGGISASSPAEASEKAAEPMRNSRRVRFAVLGIAVFDISTRIVADWTGGAPMGEASGTNLYSQA